ncbi:addiction module toxin RelE [Halioglobus sp. HI00S01]|uniref:REP-associated tyrosine transposase n=1 Tax=Halioglobus sp. HI00S01 TaxID=1822214 RepID=UPI0007C335C4|nr:transposase [Halioglobus sp. HI00S01]KZX58593.1 addiction module toxin RelE [Halioglobus sp. HI00S01]
MARPLRIEFPGALYHVTSRGDRKQSIFEDDRDRHIFLNTLGDAADTYQWQVFAYCLMGNHYHLLVRTPDANLSRGMRHLNGVFTQATNRRHERVGHVFQGRYKSILVDGQAYLLEVARYILLNPVRAGLIAHPARWSWSSYQATFGTAPAPHWLHQEALLGRFEGNNSAFEQFVLRGIEHPIWDKLNQQIYLGDDAFIAQMQRCAPHHEASVPKVQCRPPAPTIPKVERNTSGRNDAIRKAHASGAYTYRQLAARFGLHPSTIGYIVTRKTSPNHTNQT